MGALVLLEGVEREAAGFLVVEGLRVAEGLRGAVALVDVLLAPPEDVEEEAFGDFARDAGVFCFVATGVRDSLVALSARRRQQYRSDRSHVGIAAEFLPG